MNLRRTFAAAAMGDPLADREERDLDGVVQMNRSLLASFRITSVGPVFGGLRRKAVLFVLLLSASLLLFPWPAQADVEGRPCVLPDMPIDYGDLILCHLGPGETHVYHFTGSPNEVITIQATHTRFATLCLELYGPDGTRITFVCDSNGTARIFPDPRLTDAGTYRIRVSGDAQDYALSLERVAPPSPSATSISYGQSIPEELNPGGDVDLYFFGGAQNDSVVIQATHTRFATLCLELYGPDGTRITSVCDSNGTARIDARPTSPGTHTIRVSGDGQPYTLNLQCLGGACPFVPPTISVTLTGCTACQLGDTFAASATLSNPLQGTIEQKLGYVLPDGSTSSIGDRHQELPPGYSSDGEVDRRTITGGDPSGTWQLCGRLLEVNVGRVLGESCRFFTINTGLAPQRN